MKVAMFIDLCVFALNPYVTMYALCHEWMEYSSEILGTTLNRTQEGKWIQKLR